MRRTAREEQERERPSAAVAARAVRLAVIHIPPRRRGLRLADLVEALAGRPTRPLQARHVSGYLITCDLQDSVQRSLFYSGTFEPNTSTLIKSHLAPGDTFLDVGANVGHYTFLAAREAGPSGRIHAIEASRETADTLAADVRSNGLEAFVSVHNVAAGATEGRAALREGDELSPVGTRYIEQGVGGDVAVVPLDELLPDSSPAVIKIDVEGADLQALRGMQRMIERAHPRLIVVEADDALLGRFGDSIASLTGYMEALAYVGEPIAEKWHAPSIAFKLRDGEEARPSADASRCATRRRTSA
jgi:FkbM family methyltransferase